MKTGKLVAKYHKTHLYYEPCFKAGTGKPVYFTSSFGVTFGIFICFDSIWPEPQLALLNNYKVTDILFPTYWVNFSPIITATEMQQAWSSHNGVNLLASNIGISYESSGSGIYSNGQILASYYNPTRVKADKLLVATVPIIQSTFKMTEKITTSKVYREFTNSARLLTNYNNKPSSNSFTVKQFIAFASQTGSLSATFDTLTCNLNYSISTQSPEGEIFGLIAQSGNENGLFDTQICGVIRCPNITSCGDFIQQSSTKFSSFELSGNFSSNTFRLGLVSTNLAEIVSSQYFEILNNITLIRSTTEFTNTILLNAVIWSSVWN